MAQDFDAAPINDAIVKDSGMLTDSWARFLVTFTTNLINFLTSGGIFLPQLTTAQRDALNNPTAGQMLFNTTTSKAQYFDGAVWQDF